jgi:hypothetical protein
MLTENPNLEFEDKYGHIIFVKENGWIYCRNKDGSKILTSDSKVSDTDIFRKSINLTYKIYEEPIKEPQKNNIIINMSCSISGAEEVEKVIKELQDKISNLKVNVSV